MKKQTILAVLLVLSVASLAQQAIWGGQNTSSPQINANNTVTFRLDAPKASAVQVTGDFLPTQQVDGQFGKHDVPGTAF
jgi:1,4-alpha-glucan branching enzyme